MKIGPIVIETKEFERALAAAVEFESMKAANEERRQNGESPAYGEEQFRELSSRIHPEEWILLKEAKPAVAMDCLVTDGVDVVPYYYDPDEPFPWSSVSAGPEVYPSSITHWMPFPDPPKDGE